MSKTIIALDFPTAEKALEFLDQFDEPVTVKVGMELFYSSGPQIIEEIKKRGHDIFLDLKLHDIPNTVGSAMKNLAKLGADIVNVHAAGGIDMMKAAKKGLVEATPEGQKVPKIIAITQLTSTSKEAMNEQQGIPGEIIDSVLRYASNAKEAGLDGVVCSVWEVDEIKRALGDDFLTVTPGIRLADDSVDDQKRVATPEVAKEKGSDYIVVGRSITKAENPKETFEKIEAVLS